MDESGIKVIRGDARTLVQLFQAQSPEAIAACRRLFLEYVQQEQVPPQCLSDFEAELQSLPGEYAPPNGALLLAVVDSAYAGCCALRPLHTSDYANAAEMRRLYVPRAFRRFGIGRDLCRAVLDAAQVAGYASVLLDTLSEMEAARALYEEFGFYEIPPYHHSPVGGSHYLKVDLR